MPEWAAAASALSGLKRPGPKLLMIEMSNLLLPSVPALRPADSPAAAIGFDP